MLSFLSGISFKSYLYIALAAGAIYLGAQGFSFVNTAIDNASLVVLQESQLSIKEAANAALQSQLEQAKNALEIAEEERQALELRNDALRDIRDRALTAGEEDNGEIAPVLGDTLRALSE